MTSCTLTSHTYNRHCPHCMARLIASARSPDKRTSRRRVFVVASARNGFNSAAVLFESEGVRRDTAPSRETGKGSARSIETGASGCCWPANVTSTLDTTFGTKQGLEDQHVNAGCSLFVPSPIALAENTIGRHPHNGGNGNGYTEGGPMYTLNTTGAHGAAAVKAEYYSHDYCNDRVYSAEGISPALNCSQEHNIRASTRVRRLTPVECERLQGFRDNYTNIKPNCPDGPRYKAIGNSWAIPCVQWIFKRINDHETTH